MKIEVIRNDAQYKRALSYVENLMSQNPQIGSKEYDDLEILSMLIERYEKEHFPVPLPDPIEAILLRMEQQDLKPRDLVPYLGSRSKVSEVLARKRPLTLSMIRALHSGLGIPTDVLTQPHRHADSPPQVEIEWNRFPLKEMIARKWIDEDPHTAKAQAKETICRWLAPIRDDAACPEFAVLFRKSHVRGPRQINNYLLAAWTARVLLVAKTRQPLMNYREGTVTSNLMRNVAKLSTPPDGPLLAKNYLEENGIRVVIEPRLKHTHLDGAVIMSSTPIIGLTLRYDRIDNFWFSLFHELAHLSLHESSRLEAFYDNDLEAKAGVDPYEREADFLASEALVPRQAWEGSAARVLNNAYSVQAHAATIGVHPAIVAGYLRHETNNYKVLKTLVGQGKVRRLFPEVSWTT